MSERDVWLVVHGDTFVPSLPKTEAGAWMALRDSAGEYMTDIDSFTRTRKALGYVAKRYVPADSVRLSREDAETISGVLLEAYLCAHDAQLGTELDQARAVLRQAMEDGK